MKLIVLLWLIKMIVCGGASTSPCTTPDCGEKEFAMKDVKFNIDFNLGEVLSRSKTKCDIPQPPIAIPTHNCKEVFKATYPSSVLNTQLIADSLTLEDLEITKGDQIRCKIEEMDIPGGSSGYKQIGYDIHTIPELNPVYMTAPSSRCFSFEVKARNDAKIILKYSLLNNDNIEIILGSNMSTTISYKIFRNDCKYTIANPPSYPIISDYDFTDYWICWTSGKAILGRGDNIIIAEKENIEIKDPIAYVGLQTTNNAAGEWRVLESNCPGCYDVETEGSNARVSCVKVQDTCT